MHATWQRKQQVSHARNLFAVRHQHAVACSTFDIQHFGSILPVRCAPDFSGLQAVFTGQPKPLGMAPAQLWKCVAAGIASAQPSGLQQACSHSSAKAAPRTCVNSDLDWHTAHELPVPHRGRRLQAQPAV